jgi:tRNA G18 (ribose-2'-O)-methylase SpoU
MTRLASLEDPRLAPYAQLADPAALVRAGLFVAEGRLVVERLIDSGRFVLRSVLVTPAAEAAMHAVLARGAAQAPVFVVPQPAMRAITGFNIHRGCLALAERPASLVLSREHLTDARRVLVLEGVNNPDNVGGLFRSAAAFNVDLVVLGPACSDPLYRKAIRTSMAAALRVPFVTAGDWPAAIDTLRTNGFVVVALTPASDAPPLARGPRDTPRLALLVGAEGEGLSTAAVTRADRVARIAMPGAVDSLNVTVAASIALYELQ